MSNKYPEDNSTDNNKEQLSFESDEFSADQNSRDLEPLAEIPGLGANRYDNDAFDSDPFGNASSDSPDDIDLSAPDFPSEKPRDDEWADETDSTASPLTDNDYEYDNEPVDMSDLPDDTPEESYEPEAPVATEYDEQETEQPSSPSYAEPDSYSPPVAPTSSGIPWGLIAAAIIAVLLVAFGTYGVVKERSTLQKENHELRTKLATAISVEQFQSINDALTEVEQRNTDLRQSLKSLTSENQGLNAQLTLLKTKLASFEEENTLATNEKKTTPQPVAASKATPKPITKPKSKLKPTVVAQTTGKWFVNFGSYGNRSTATTWAKRLTTNQRTAAVTDVKTGSRTLYRVRIINLESRAQANSVARELEKTHKLEPLWVGQQ